MVPELGVFLINLASAYQEGLGEQFYGAAAACSR